MTRSIRAPWFGTRRRACGGWMIVAILLTLAAPAHAQRRTDTLALRTLSQQFRSSLEARRTPAYYNLLASTDPAQQALNRRRDIRLMYMDDRGHPVYYILNNLNAAKTVRTWNVWPLGVGGGAYSLTGSTTLPGELAMWDGDGVLTSHQEFGGRVTQMDAPGITSEHATHVAGTMVAGGVDANARGMAYEAPLHAYDWNFDTSEMANAAGNGLRVSNHSYGIAAGWDVDYWFGDLSISTTEDYRFGFYDANAYDFDVIAHNAINYLICAGSGNDRNDAPFVGTHFHWNGASWVAATDVHGHDGQFGGYDTVPGHATAKNVLTVGAVNDIPGGYTVPSDVVQSAFSSWGPCDDGRIKPDVVANGVSLYSSTDGGTTDYGSLSGTSMSTPSVSASVDLIGHEYQRRFGFPPLASTVKAIVINTADEAGPSDGPDYQNGWGLMNTQRAIDLLALHGHQDGGTYEWWIQTGEVHEYYFTVDSPQDARLTLVWTDEAGFVLAPSLDPGTKMLINDLDIRMTHVASGITYEPWILNPAVPATAAVTGDNITDNVEQVDIAGAPAGLYYVTVTVKNAVALAQDYSLVWRGMRATGPPSYTSGGFGYIDLGGPEFPATVHLEQRNQERGVFFTAIRNVAVMEIGMNLAIPFPTPMTVTLYEANGLARGPMVATSTTTIRHPGEIVHYVPLVTLLEACQDYELVVRFHYTVSWPAWDEPPGGAIPSVDEPFDVGAAIRVRDGTRSGNPFDPMLPHFVFKGSVLPEVLTDLNPPGALWNPAPAFNGFTGVYVSPHQTLTIDNIGFMVGFLPNSIVRLTARVYEAAGSTRGPLIAEGESYFNNGLSTSIQLWGIPIEAVLEEGKEYDIEVQFPTNASWHQIDESGVTPVTVGPLRLLDAEMEGNPASTMLPHLHLFWTEQAGGAPFDLSKHNDVIPPPFAVPAMALERGLYVTSNLTQRVYSLGLRADVPAGVMITMRIYEASGTTRGPLVTEGHVISTGGGTTWHDVPLAAELVAGGDYDFEASVPATNGWRFWDDTLGLPYNAYGVIIVRDAEQSGNPLANELVHMRMNGCDTQLTPVDGPALAPAFALAAPYPNPATGVTTVDFSLDRDEVASIAVYDVAGRRVATLLEASSRSAGRGSVSFDAAGIASGVYFVRMTTPTRSVSRKITVVR